MTYSILINDGMEKDGLEIFDKEKVLYVNEHIEGKNLLDTLGNFDAFLVRSKTKVTKEIIEAGSYGKLRMIGRGGVGVDNIDILTANNYGIIVKFAPNGVTNSTAEHAIGLLFSVARKIPQSHHVLKKGIWKKNEFKGIELEGKTFGVIGCGRIGQSVAEKARALGMNVIGYDSIADKVREKFPDSLIKYVSKESVLGDSDAISLHSGGKELIISEKELALMKTSAILINASRGNNVDENALYNALLNGRIYGAGLDTYFNEPKKEGQEITDSMRRLASLENVVLTSHLGAATKEGQRKTSIELARITLNYLLNGDYANSVNTMKPSEEKGSYTICVYHEDIPGMFGKITRILAENEINMRNIKSEQILGDGKVITNCIIHQPLDLSTLGKLKVIKGVQRVLFTDPK